MIQSRTDDSAASTALPSIDVATPIYF